MACLSSTKILKKKKKDRKAREFEYKSTVSLYVSSIKTWHVLILLSL